MTKVTIRIDGRELQAESGSTVLQVALANGIDIPTLCHHAGLVDVGACRVCLVEIDGPGGRPTVMASCTLPASEGLVVRTETEAVKRNRRTVVELLLGRAPKSEAILALAARDGLTESRYTPMHDAGDCVLCGLCVRVCEERLGAEAITYRGRTFAREISAAFGKLSDSCLACGSCAAVCPTGVMRVVDTETTRRILRNDLEISERKLLRCGSCGAAICSEEFHEWIVARQQPTHRIDGADGLCPDCSRHELAKRMCTPLTTW